MDALLARVLVDEGDDELDARLGRLGEDEVHLVQPAAVPHPVVPLVAPAVDVPSTDVLALDLRAREEEAGAKVSMGSARRRTRQRGGRGRTRSV